MSRYDDLERLAKLHSEGVLTDEEFLREKNRLLAGHTVASPDRQTEATNPAILISTKSRLVTLLLCIFLGTFGVHRLYLKRTKSALLMAALALLSFFSCVKVMSPADLSSSGSMDSGWEYFGELNFDNGNLFMNSQNMKPFASAIFLGFVLEVWRLLDFILILIGQFRDSRRRLVLRW